MVLLALACGFSASAQRELAKMNADSLASALATLWGDYVKNKAQKDGKEVTKEYMRGLEDALRQGQTNDAYLQGYREGATIADRLNQVEMMGGFDIDLNKFISALNKISKGRTAGFTRQSAEAFMNNFMAQVEAEKYIVEGSPAFLEAAAKKEGVVKTPSGLLFEVLTEGEGDQPGPNDAVLVNYNGYFIDKRVFNSTPEGHPVVLDMTGVIPGFREGLQMMKKGGRYRLYIPSDLGYSVKDSFGLIPEGAALIFDVDLIDLRHATAAPTEPEAPSTDKTTE